MLGSYVGEIVAQEKGNSETNFHFGFLLGVLEARSCEKGALRKAYVRKLCGEACSEVQLEKSRVVVVPN